jgi:DNA-binding IscR family transcriptional regulator
MLRANSDQADSSRSPQQAISANNLFRSAHECEYTNAAEHLAAVWVAARAALRKVLDETSLAHVLAGKLPQHVRRMAESPEAWLPR